MMSFFTQFLNACAPKQQEFDPFFTETAMTDDVFILRDEYQLPYRAWHSHVQPEKGVFIAVHGFNDYSYAFKDFAQFMAKQQYTIYAYDQRGFGKTENKGIWPGTKNLIYDLKDVIELVAKKHPSKPLYLIGESMGGAVVSSTLTTHQLPEVEGTILVSPAFWSREIANPFQNTALWIASHTFPWAKLSGESLNRQPTDNIEILKEFSTDPHIIHRSRVDTLYGIVNLMDYAWERLPLLNTNLLVLYGDKEDILPHYSLDAARKRVPKKKCHHFIDYPEGYHLLLRDKQNQKVFQDIKSWLDQTCL